MDSSKNRDYRISNIRSICIIFVVLAHSVIIYKSGWGLYDSNVTSKFFDWVCNIIYIFHMPLFFAISGFLFFSSRQKTAGLVNLLKNKARRLLVPYVCIGLLWLLPIRYIAHYSGYMGNSIFYNLLKNVLLGFDNGHLWFLLALYIIFAMEYLIINKISNKWVRLFIVLLLFAIGQKVPIFVGRAMQNVMWFHLGYMVNELKISGKNQPVYPIGAVLFTGVWAINLSVLNLPGFVGQIIKIVACLFIILTMFSVVPSKSNRVINFIDRNSFGLYLFHSPLIYIIYDRMPDINPIFMFIINFVMLGSVAVIITYGIRKTKLKFIVGE